MNSAEVLKVLQGRIGSADWTKWQTHRWQFYDYVRYPVAGTGQLLFFVNPIGAADPVSTNAKTLEETNCPKPRSFGQVYFIVQQIRTHIHLLAKGRQHATIAALTNWVALSSIIPMRTLMYLAHQGVLKVSIGQKDYYDIDQPFLNAPPGMGVKITQHANALSAATGMWFKVSDDIRNVYNLSPPQLIEPENVLDVSINFPNANSPVMAQVSGVDVRVNIGVILDGFIARPAQ